MAKLIRSLSDALSSLKRFEGTLTGYRSGRLHMQSANSYGVNQSMRLAVTLDAGGRRLEESFKVHLVASRVMDDGRTIEYAAEFREDPKEQAGRLAALWQAREAARAGAQHSGPEMRVMPRLSRVFRVLSPDLANYRATTRDVSETGLCLACEGPVEPGRELELTLDLDTFNLPNLKCRARVVWCREEDRAHLAGLHFTELSPHGKLVLQAYLEQVRSLKHPGEG